jgi:hypothetical protein
VIPLHADQIVAAIERRTENDVRGRELGERPSDEQMIESRTVRSDDDNRRRAARKRLADRIGHSLPKIAIVLRAKLHVVTEPTGDHRPRIRGCVANHDMGVAHLTRHGERMFGETAVDRQCVVGSELGRKPRLHAPSLGRANEDDDRAIGWGWRRQVPRTSRRGRGFHRSHAGGAGRRSERAYGAPLRSATAVCLLLASAGTTQGDI